MRVSASVTTTPESTKGSVSMPVATPSATMSGNTTARTGGNGMARLARCDSTTTTANAPVA